MKTALLRLMVSGKRIAFVVSGRGLSEKFPGPSLDVAKRLHAELEKHEFSATDDRAPLLKRYVSEFAPPRFSTWFGQWSSDTSDDSVLCVHVDHALLSELPWGEMLFPAGVPPGRSWVARACNMSGPAPPPDVPIRMLLAGWMNLTGYTMPGVIREIKELRQKIDQILLPITVLPDPTRRRLLA